MIFLYKIFYTGQIYYRKRENESRDTTNSLKYSTSRSQACQVQAMRADIYMHLT